MLLALTLTIIIELFVAFIVGFRKKDDIPVFVLINLITNPFLNYIFIINDYFFLIDLGFPAILLLEALVVLVEWRLLVFVFGKTRKRLLLLSFLMNLCSFLVGFFIIK